MRKFILCLIFLASCAWQKHFPDYPVTATSAANSTFKIIISENGIPQGSGTAWIVGIQENTTYIMTAGHVCNHSPLDTYELLSQDDKTYVATKKMSATDPDLCLLTHEGYIGKPLWISTHDLVYGDPVAYVGAPNGHYGKGLAPYYKGNYLGNRYMSAPTYPGASGSAIWTPDGVVGVLVTVDMEFNTIAGFVTRQEIINFTSLAGFNFGKAQYPTVPGPEVFESQ